MPVCPKKGQKGAKVGGAVGLNVFAYCSISAHYIFLIFYINLEDIKEYKLSQTPYLRKFSFLRFRPKSSRPIRSLYFLNCYIFWTVQSFFIIFCIKMEYHKTFKMMFHFSGKMPVCSTKGQKGAKVGRAVGQKSTFLYIVQNWFIRFFWYFAWS